MYSLHFMNYIDVNGIVETLNNFYFKETEGS